MGAYTPAQLSMFVNAAVRRKNQELLTQMSVAAASSTAAFTGSTGPMEGIEKALVGEAKAYGSELQNRLKGFARSVGALQQ